MDTTSLEIIITAIAVIGFVIGFLIAVVRWGQASRLEKLYRRTVEAIKLETEYTPEKLVTIPERIIVEIDERVSPLRTLLLKINAIIRNSEIPRIVLVFGLNSEPEREAFVMKQAFVVIEEVPLFDLDLLESLVNYRAYKFVQGGALISETAKSVLRRDFERSPYRECILNLDSAPFELKVVVNPPPTPKPLLSDVIIPLIGEKAKELRSTGNSLPEIEHYKSLFTEVVKRLCAKKCGVLFIGVRPAFEYVDMLLDGLKKYDMLIVAARGRGHTNLLLRVIVQASEKAGLEWTNYRQFQTLGSWTFPDHETVCLWIIVIRIATYPHIEDMNIIL